MFYYSHFVNELVIFHKMHTYVMSEVVKVIELVGTPEQGWTRQLKQR